MNEEIERLKIEIARHEKRRDELHNTINELAERYLKESRLREELQKDHDDLQFDNDFLCAKIQEQETEIESLKGSIINRLDKIERALYDEPEHDPDQLNLL